MRISIVMSYFKRQEQLDATVRSIRKSEVKDYEIIIVDDASPEPVHCKDATIITIKPEDKWYTNPCVPFNTGIQQATGDIVILQNPECYHVGDILSFADKYVRKGTYISFACYALNRNESIYLRRGMLPVLEDRMFYRLKEHGWYNHSKIRPVGYHFCSAVTREELNELGGFDLGYARGVGYDDDDLVMRVKQKMRLVIVDEPYVLHQYHNPVYYRLPGMMELHDKNKKLFHDTWRRLQ